MKIKINGNQYDAAEGMTILEAVEKSANIKIPALCHDSRTSHTASCFLCCVEDASTGKLLPSCSSEIKEGMSILTDSPSVIKSRKECLSLLLSEHCGNCVSPCSAACPAGIDVQGYLSLAKEGKFSEALELIIERNPLPSVCGRVCVKFCEKKCRRRLIDASVAINAVKRTSADCGKRIISAAKDKKGKAAVIGGGPAGLSFAFYASKAGYETTIFEAMPKAGGLLRYGIPSYRLPRRILDMEISEIEKAGVTIKTGTRVGTDISFEEIRKSHDIVFIASGAWKPSPAGMENENAGNVTDAISFLSKTELGAIKELNGKAVVIGGGNSAMDAARTAVRLGAEETVVLYRRTKEDMPADPEEIEDAEKEGVKFIFLASPKKAITGEDGCIKSLECIRMKQGERDCKGRRSVSAEENSEFIIECSHVIVAAGQKCAPDFLKGYENILDRGRIITEGASQKTSEDGIYAGGDAVSGPATVIEAIAAGRRAVFGDDRKKGVSFCTETGTLEKSTACRSNRAAAKKLPPETASKSFEEAEESLSGLEASDECSRCLKCGCGAYDKCLLRKYSEEYGASSSKNPEDTGKKQMTEELGSEYIIFDPAKCILCQKCIKTCERASGRYIPGLINRGYDSVIGFSGGKKLSETECISCGNCADSCPAGALQNAGAKPYSKESAGTCILCGGLCDIKIKSGYGHVSVMSARNSENPYSDYICKRGRNELPSYFMEKKPMEGSCEVSYERAVEAAAEAIMAEVDESAIGIFVSSYLSDREAYAAVKLGKGIIGTDCVIPFDLAEEREFSSKKALIPIQAGAGIEAIKNSDLIFAVSGNIEKTCHKAATAIREAVLGGARLICIGTAEQGLEKFSAAELDYDIPEEVIKLLGNDDETIAMFKERGTRITAVCPASHLECANSLALLLKKCNSLSGEGKGLVIVNSGANTSGAIKMGAFPGLLPGGLGYDNKRAAEIYLKSWKRKALPEECKGKSSIKTGIFVGEMPSKGMFRKLDKTILISASAPTEANMPDVFIPFSLTEGVMTGTDGRKRASKNSDNDGSKTLTSVLADIADALGKNNASIMRIEDKFERHALSGNIIVYNAKE